MFFRRRAQEVVEGQGFLLQKHLDEFGGDRRSDKGDDRGDEIGEVSGSSSASAPLTANRTQLLEV